MQVICVYILYTASTVKQLSAYFCVSTSFSLHRFGSLSSSPFRWLIAPYFQFQSFSIYHSLNSLYYTSWSHIIRLAQYKACFYGTFYKRSVVRSAKYSSFLVMPLVLGVFLVLFASIYGECVFVECLIKKLLLSLASRANKKRRNEKQFLSQSVYLSYKL